MNKREGAFIFNEEQFIVRRIEDGSEYDGMFEVVDSTGFMVATAFTRKLAINNAITEIEYHVWTIDQFLSAMFGETA